MTHDVDQDAHDHDVAHSLGAILGFQFRLRELDYDRREHAKALSRALFRGIPGRLSNFIGGR